MATTIFGQKTKAKLFIPKGTATWDIKDVVKKGEFDNVLLMSFSISDQEIIDVKRCFEETTHIFAFGRNPNVSVLQVSVLLFLYDGCPSGAHPNWLKVEDLRKKYKEYRVYEKQDSIRVAIDTMNVDGFLIKMTVDDVNPNNNSCTIGFTFLIDQEV
jgi:hypothetical protein